jgi:hypothetical protein
MTTNLRDVTKRISFGSEYTVNWEFDDANLDAINDNFLDVQEKLRFKYLKSTAAVPTPIAAMALWVAVWEAQTGEEVHMYRDGSQQLKVTVTAGVLEGATMTYTAAKDAGIEDKDLLMNPNVSYKDLSWRNWTPTRLDVRIPPGHGTNGLSLFMVLGDQTPDLQRATMKHTPGWEWGHTEVFVLGRDENGLFAETNAPLLMFGQDVVEMARNNTIEALLRRLHPQDTPEAPVESVALTPRDRTREAIRAAGETRPVEGKPRRKLSKLFSRHSRK